MRNEKKILQDMPKLDSRRVDELLECVLGCRWTIAVLRAVSDGVARPGALERHVQGISAKVLADRLRRFTRAGILERVQFAEIPPRVEYRLTPFGKKFTRVQGRSKNSRLNGQIRANACDGVWWRTAI